MLKPDVTNSSWVIAEGVGNLSPHCVAPLLYDHWLRTELIKHNVVFRKQPHSELIATTTVKSGSVPVLNYNFRPFLIHQLIPVPFFLQGNQLRFEAWPKRSDKVFADF